MNPDLLALLERYGAEADAMAPPIEIDEVITRRLLEPEPTVRRTLRRPWVVAMAAAAAVLLLIGGVALMMRLLAEDSPVVTEPDQTTVTTAAATSTTAAPGTTATPTTTPITAADAGLPSRFGTMLVSPLATAGDVGGSPTVALRSDGTPVVAFVDDTAGAVGIALCSDSACGAEPTILSVDGDTRTPPGLTIMPGDIPAIVYAGWTSADREGEADAVFLARCATSACERLETAEIEGIDNATALQVASGPAGYPVLAYIGGDPFAPPFVGEISVTACNDPACAETSTSVIDTTTGTGPGLQVSLAVDRDGNPVLYYYGWTEETGQFTRLARCGDPACAGEIAVTEMPSPPDAGNSLALLPDGRPSIAYLPFEEMSPTGAQLVVIGCDDLGCSNPVETEVDAYGRWADHVATGDGTLVIAVSGSQGMGGMEIVTCRDGSCAEDPTVTNLTAFGPALRAAVALDAEGRPVIAFQANSDLHLARCDEIPCDAGPVEQTATAPGWSATVVAGDASLVGANPTFLLDGDGLPIILHTVERVGADDHEMIRLIRCRDAACVERDEQLIEDASTHGPLVLRSDGLPVLAYLQNWERLQVAVCDDPLCTSLAATTIAEGWVSNAPALTLTDQGFPVVSVFDDFEDYDYYHDVVVCSDLLCAGERTVATLFNLVHEDDYRFWPNNADIAIGPNGNPLVVVGESDGSVHVVVCADPACVGNTAIEIDTTGLDTLTSEMILGADGLPVIAYYADGALKVARCEDADCTSFSLHTVAQPATAEWIGTVAPSLALGPDGNPVVAYWAPGRILHLAWCEDPACSSSVDDTYGPANTFALEVDGDGYPVLVYHRGTDLVVAACSEQSCAAP